MNSLLLAERHSLAEKLRAQKGEISVVASSDFLDRHPDFLVRFGERARVHYIEDTVFHLDFLAGAIETGSEQPFIEYARWTMRMLQARHISPDCVAENFTDIATRLAPFLNEREHAVASACLAAGAAAVQEVAVPGATSDQGPALAQARTHFLDAILQGQRKAAAAIAQDAAGQSHELLDVYVEIFQESLYQVGRLWESNQISVADEHMATAITQYVIASASPKVRPAVERRGRVVITGVSGELHQVGALMVADVLEAQGFDVRFLGTNLPNDAIIQAVIDHKAEVLGISVTMLFNLSTAVALVTEARARLGDRMPRLMLGGAAFKSSPALAAELGAIGVGNDLRSAAQLMA